MQIPAVFTFNSILDNDFYKFTMQQGVVRLFPGAKARYKFINRGKHSFPPGFAGALTEAIQQMVKLKLTKEEKTFLQVTCPYLDPVYLDFLEGYQYQPDEVKICQHEDQIEVEIEGFWYRTILWEVPILSLISELYYTLSKISRISDEEVVERSRMKIEKFKTLGVTLADFGTRRRHSYQVHRLVISTLCEFGSPAFIGTSNVHLAMLHGIKPIGTHAHEWFMFHAARYGFKMANAMGLEHWVDVYRGDLGIALSDTYTTPVFLKQFDKMFSKLFDGVRHDSGEPKAFADQIINHYKQMGIDPMSKTIIFSDGLNYDKVADIAEYCRDRIGMSFGVGTNLSNDAGPQPMNIVIKLSAAQPQDGEWTEVVKLSDEQEKHTGTEELIRLSKIILGITAY